MNQKKGEETPRIWHISDRHLCHRRCGTVHRGFATIEEHDEFITGRCEELLGPGDRLDDHGDEALGLSGRVLELLARTPCRQHLILGNHSVAHPMNRHPRWTQAKWEGILKKTRRVYDTVTLLDSRVISGQVVMLSHLPYEGDHTPEERHQRWRPRDAGDWLLCGHVHAEWLIRGRQINIGVDQWGMGPVPEDILAPVLDGSAGPGEIYAIRDRWIKETGGRPVTPPAARPL